MERKAKREVEQQLSSEREAMRGAAALREDEMAALTAQLQVCFPLEGRGRLQGLDATSG